MSNGCKTKIEFTCEVYKQPSCRYFEQDKEVPTTACQHGLFERSCRNLFANEQSLLEALKKRRQYEKTRKD